MSEPNPVLESPEQVLSTLHRDGRRRWLYPVVSRGRYHRRRLVTGWALVVLFVSLPLVPVGGKPAVLLDLIAREFTFFGLTLYLTDSVLLMLFLLLVLVAVFLFTAVLGRVWCGWACPQTVYLEFVFRPIERLVEGRANVRRRRDEGPSTFDRVWRKGLKWTLYVGVSVALAHVFVAYFAGWERLVRWMSASPLEQPAFFAVMAATSGLILFDFGIFREQMCTIACPYARLQSVLQDRDSMIVSYDPGRGEPRGRRKKNAALTLGDCVDCGACVRTCPTGIDIRDGLQMECIGCTQCIDACDQIMDSVRQPRGLIRYTSENELAGQRTKVFRPRTVAYAAILFGLLSMAVYVVAQRTPVDVNIGRAVGPPFGVLPDQSVTNRLRFRIQNRTSASTTYQITALHPDGLELKAVGNAAIRVEPGHTERLDVWVVVPATAIPRGSADALFRVRGEDGATSDVAFTLLGPTAAQ